MSRPSSSVPSRCSEAGRFEPVAGRRDRRLERADEQLRRDGHDREEDEDRRGRRRRPGARELAPERRGSSRGPERRTTPGAAAGRRRRRAHVRTRGSRTPYMRSAPRLARTTAIDRIRKIALQDREVTDGQRLDGQRPEARPVEDDLGGDRAGDDVAEVDGDDRDRRQQGVREARAGARRAARSGPWPGPS